MKKVLLIIYLLFSVCITKASPTWSVNPNAYSNSMTMTSVISIDSIELDGTSNQVAAFVDNECRGVANLFYIKSLDRYVAFLVLYSNNTSGDLVTFKAYNATNNQEYDMLNKEVFELDKIFGSIANPYVFTNTNMAAGFTEFTFKDLKTNFIDINVYKQSIDIEVDDTIDVSNLIADFTLNSVSSKVTVNNIVQESGVTANNFDNVVTYLIYNSLNQVTTWTVNITKKVVLSVDDEINQLPIFYPNPASDKIYLFNNQGNATLYTVNGDEALRTDKNELDVSLLTKGVYILNYNGRKMIVEIQ